MTLFSVLAKPKAFFWAISLDTPTDFLRASRFAPFTSVLVLVIQTPVFRLLGVQKFGWVRGLGAGVLAFLGWLAIGLTVVAPADQLFQKSFLK